tara:strand:+ start:2334 stop:3557 length:1224 start_codon:yes stop_codon:yes gene_type:complete
MFKTFRRQSPVETVLQILWSEPKVSRQAGCDKSACPELNTRLAMWRTVIRRLHATNRVGWDEYIPLWQALKLQARYNSPLFSSHGINHSMCTAYFMCILMKTMPGMNVALWAALLHDVGYSEYELCQRPENCDEMKRRLTPLVGENNSATGIRSDIYRKNKFLHAKLGANMVQHLLRTSPRLFNPNDVQKMVKAISEHNADSHNSMRYDPSRDGTFMSIHNYCVARKYRLAIFEERPLLTLLRLADNLDISRNRLTIEQQSQALVSYQRWLYNHADASVVSKSTVWERLCGLFGLVGNKMLADMLFEKSTPEEFKFTYSCWILQWVTIENWNIPQLVLNVELYRPSISSLAFENNFQEGRFQFRRLHSALQSIRVNGALLDVRVNMNGKQYLLDKLLEFENYEEMIK